MSQTTTIAPESCDSFVWHVTTKGRCHTCHVPRDNHVGGYISQRDTCPELTAHLSQPCDECDRTAESNGVSRLTGERGKFCNAHVSWDHPAFARND